MIEDQQAGTIKLVLSPVQSIKELGDIQIFPYDRFVENITSELIDEKVELTIFLKTPEVQAKIQTRDWPFELVLEIRPFDIETVEVAERVQSSPEASAPNPSNNSAVRGSGPRWVARPIAIRTGYHESYSRIVVEFDKQVNHEVSLDEEDRALLLDLRPVDSASHLMPLRIHPQDRYLDNLDYQVDDSTLKIVATLETPDVQFDSYELDSPFRIIVDIRPLIPPLKEVSQKEEQLTTAESIPTRAENQPDSILVEILRGEVEVTDVAMLDSTGSVADTLGFKVGPNFSAFTLDLGSNLSKQASLARPANRSMADSKMRIFIKVVIGFIIFDILLAGIYFRRPRKSKKSRSVDSNPPTHERAQSIARNREFMDVLATTLRERNAITEPSQPFESAGPLGVKAAVKIDHMIDSLSTALGGITSLEESDVALDPFMHELHNISASSGLTVEDIIGRDGQEFARNLKRLQNK
jgi:hypothetical protein